MADDPIVKIETRRLQLDKTDNDFNNQNQDALYFESPEIDLDHMFSAN